MRLLTSKTQAKLYFSLRRTIGGIWRLTFWILMCHYMSFITFINLALLLFATHSYDEATGTMDAGYPRPIEEDFPGIDDEIDAAAYHHGTVKPQISSFISEGFFQCYFCVVFLTLFPSCTFRSFVFLPWTIAVWVQLHFKESNSHPENQLHSKLLMKWPVTAMAWKYAETKLVVWHSTYNNKMYVNTQTV